MRVRLLEVKDLSVSRKNKKLLEDISFELHSMEILSVIGPKGAGKGLLFKTLLGIQKGSVQGKVQTKGKMGLVSLDYPCLEELTIFQNLSLVAKLSGIHSQTHLAEEIEETLKAVGLWAELKLSLHVPVGSLSLYQKCVIDLARTLLLKPNIILLDKPTMPFDPEKKNQYEAIVEKLKNNISFIWINHDLEQVARVSDQVLFLKEGRMIEVGTAENVFTMPLKRETEFFISRRMHE